MASKFPLDILVNSLRQQPIGNRDDLTLTREDIQAKLFAEVTRERRGGNVAALP